MPEKNSDTPRRGDLVASQIQRSAENAKLFRETRERFLSKKWGELTEADLFDFAKIVGRDGYKLQNWHSTNRGKLLAEERAPESPSRRCSHKGRGNIRCHRPAGHSGNHSCGQS